jgi:GDP-4-dehydro-6-deoxy-D-mannose reductase
MIADRVVSNLGIRVVVTGSGGFVGRWLVRRLNQPEMQDRVEVYPLFEEVDGIAAGDITDEGAVDNAINRIKPDCVVHLAAIANPIEGSKHPRRLWDVNLFGTFNLARAVLRHVPHARIIFASSSDVYGSSFNSSELPIFEDAVACPVRSYGASKLAAEILLRQLSYEGLKPVIFRPFNHTGPGQASVYVVSSFARQIAEVEAGLVDPVLKVGNLDAKRDFLDVRDVVEAYADAMLAAQIPACEPINLSTGSAVSVGVVLETLLRMSNCNIQVRIDSELMRPSDIPIMSGNPKRAETIYGWMPRIPLQITLRDTLSYWRTQIRSRSKP